MGWYLAALKKYAVFTGQRGAKNFGCSFSSTLSCR